ncbi:MAG: hypothetical protein WC260_01530 [Candidatus Pacearchaeota archaeon]
MSILDHLNIIMESKTVNEFYHGSPYDFDTFDIDKVGTGDGLSKFGFGLYFTDSEELANYYAIDGSIGDKKQTGLNIYQVRLFELDNFYEWEQETPPDIYDCVIRKLRSLEYEDDADEIEQDYEDYGDRWSIESLYAFLTAIFDSDRETSEFLYKCGISGVIADDLQGRGRIYVTYTDKIIKLINRWKVGKR